MGADMRLDPAAFSEVSRPRTCTEARRGTETRFAIGSYGTSRCATDTTVVEAGLTAGLFGLSGFG